jgi:ribonuclease VapC
MIVLDSSILIAVVKQETGSAQFLEVLAAEECAIGAPTLVEARAWCIINLPARSSRWLEEFVARERVATIPFARDMADVASQAFARFGKGTGHSAKLNFGDCMAYAVSTVLRAPLLFKGTDFGQTDVLVHSAAIHG